MSTISNIYVNTTFYHESGLTWNQTFYGSICYVLYLHILCFYFVRHFMLRLEERCTTKLMPCHLNSSFYILSIIYTNLYCMLWESNRSSNGEIHFLDMFAWKFAIVVHGTFTLLLCQLVHANCCSHQWSNWSQHKSYGILNSEQVHELWLEPVSNGY